MRRSQMQFRALQVLLFNSKLCCNIQIVLGYMHAESLACKVESGHYSQLGKTLSTDRIVRHHLETS